MRCNGILLPAVLIAIILLTPSLFPTHGQSNSQPGAVPPPGISAYAPDPTIAGILKNVSKNNLYNWTYALQNLSTRFDYSKKFNDSTNYTYNKFKQFPNLLVERQQFVYSSHILNNVIATLPGQNPSNKTVFVIGGHYDSIWYTDSGTSFDLPEHYAPGADDDGSGAVLTLEVARLFSGYKFENTIIFANWAAEEVGLVGSSYFARNADVNGMKIGGYLNFDMVANDENKNDNNYKLAIGGTEDSFWLRDLMIDLNKNYSIGLNITPRNEVSQGSDHASFVAHGYPAIECEEGDFSPNWHQPTDTVDNMNFEQLRRVTQVAAAGLATISGLKPTGIGVLNLDRSRYSVDGTVHVSLYDTALNIDPGKNESATVTVNSTSSPAGLSVALNETAPDGSVFAGAVALTHTSPAPAGKLLVKNGDMITARFLDSAVSPPVYRTADAYADGQAPKLWNVSAVPGVDVATVYFSTDENGLGKVHYGQKAPLGSSSVEISGGTRHAVFLHDLSPNKVYYFDVEVADDAGNKATDSNGGKHFAFVTMLGQTARPAPGYAYWVRENPAAPGGVMPHADGGLRTGYGSTYHRYHGTFQMNVSSVPAGTVVTNASLSLFGQGWVAKGGIGLWRLQLLSSAIDLDFPDHMFAQIDNAPTDAQIPPSLNDSQLDFKHWNSFYFAPSQYAVLADHMTSGKISFRLDGPMAGNSHVFSWDSGWGVDSIGRQYAPMISITYSDRGDSRGPVAMNLKLTPNPAPGSGPVTLTAQVYDTDTGNSKVSSAEWFIGSDPGAGSGVPMAASDSSMASPSEWVQAEIDVSHLAPGGYPVYVRGRDSCGNWGHAAMTTLHIGPQKNNTWSIKLPDRAWRLVSIPLVNSSGLSVLFKSIEGQFGRVLCYCPDDTSCPWKEYNPNKPGYLSELTVLDNSMGFWLNLSAPAAAGTIELAVSGFNATTTKILLRAGWNLIGYPSMTPRKVSDVFKGIKYDYIQGFNATAPHYIVNLPSAYMMKPGEGYWVHATAEAVLTVNWS